MKLLFALVTAVALPGCGVFPKVCNDMGCIGSAEVALVDAAGDPVAPSGELRRVGGSVDLRPFDCAATSDVVTEYAECENGVLVLGYLGDRAERFELRFELEGAEWSDWQEVQLELTPHTDPDFNGPGCECTWLEGRAEPLVVPADAL